MLDAAAGAYIRFRLGGVRSHQLTTLNWSINMNITVSQSVSLSKSKKSVDLIVSQSITQSITIHFTSLSVSPFRSPFPPTSTTRSLPIGLLLTCVPTVPRTTPIQAPRGPCPGRPTMARPWSWTTRAAGTVGWRTMAGEFFVARSEPKLGGSCLLGQNDVMSPY